MPARKLQASGLSELYKASVLLNVCGAPDKSLVGHVNGQLEKYLKRILQGRREGTPLLHHGKLRSTE